MTTPPEAPDAARDDVEVFYYSCPPFVRGGLDSGWYWEDSDQDNYHGPFTTQAEARQDAEKERR